MSIIKIPQPTRRKEIVHTYTVEPPNKEHIGARSFVLYREVSFIRRLKCTGVLGIWTSRFVLYREVSFIRGVLYRRFHCIATNYTHFWKLKGDNVVLLGLW